ncbi:NUDIX domain-containing protein [Streptomyces sp. NBC_00203]|uniref:NUDIX domain-containing protein n=1 Tax=Streptomyces sp. NBC_00203 TaxID=2975680 RepID=UPI00386B70FA
MPSSWPVFARTRMLPLPWWRREPGGTSPDCACRELREEAGVIAERWRSLGPYAIPGPPAVR